MEIKYGTFFKWNRDGSSDYNADAGLCMVTYEGAVSLAFPNKTWGLNNDIHWITEQVQRGNVTIIEGSLMFCEEDGLFYTPVGEV